jgi:hypothetical protein
MTLVFVGWFMFCAGWVGGAWWAGRHKVVIHWVQFSGSDRFARINPVTHDAERN